MSADDKVVDLADANKGTTKDVEFPGWIGDFLYYTSELTTPHIFRLWTAISTIAGALERRVWVNSSGQRAYPNLFIMLVAPPGIGKSVAIKEGRRMWMDAGNLNVAPNSLPGKGLIDELNDEKKQKTAIDPESNRRETYHPMSIPAPEMGTLIPSHDLGFLSMLNELFDCNDNYDERTRTGGQYYIEKPHVNLIVGTQPKYLGSTFPEEAFGMGFTSRMIMVYSSDEVKVDDLFDSVSETRDQKIHDKLVHHIQNLSDMIGPFEIEDEAKKAFMDWYQEGMPPQPQHSKLAHYNTRRHFHMLKLIQVFSASRSTEQVITKEDFELSRLVLVEAEQNMPEIFKEISAGSQSAEIEETYRFLHQEYVKAGQKPIREQKLHYFLSRRVPTYQIESIIDTMINAGFIVEVTDSTQQSSRKFKPMAPE